MNNSKLLFILTLLISIGYYTHISAVSGSPDTPKNETEEIENTQPNNSAEFQQSTKQLDTFSIMNNSGLSQSDNLPDQPTIELTEEMLDTIDKYENLLKRKQFDKALEELQTLPDGALNKKQRKEKNLMMVFNQISIDQAENERQFGKDESLDQNTQRTVKRLQRESKLFIMNEKNDLARDILIQSLFLDRKSFVSKQLLERCLNLPLGSYRVENVEKKYWEESLIKLRSGYPMQSVDALEVLANFDPENPMIFERMGSAFYMSGQVSKSIDAWKRALYLNPENKALKTFIENAVKEEERQKALTKEYFASKKKAQANAGGENNIPMQVLRVVNDSNTAYSYAQEVRQQMPGMQVSVEELDNGKWAVKIPKKEKK